MAGRGILAVMILLVSLPVFGQDRQQAYEWRTIQVINGIREKEGLLPLVPDAAASLSAALHADELAGRLSLSHVGLDGSRVASRYTSAGGSGLSAGENLGAGDGVDRIVAAWLDSPGHRDNMLNPKWRKLGVGVHVLESGRIIIVAVFSDSRFEILHKDSATEQDGDDAEAYIDGLFLLSRSTFPSRIELSCSSGSFTPESVRKETGDLRLVFRFPVPAEWLEGNPAAFRLVCTENGKEVVTDIMIVRP